jgi:DNA primase RepB-like protein
MRTTTKKKYNTSKQSYSRAFAYDQLCKRNRQKRGPFTYFAYEKEGGGLDLQAASSNGYVYVSAEGRKISAIATADFKTIATFKKAWTCETLEIEVGGEKVKLKKQKLLKTKDNLYSLAGNFVDIDGDSSIPLSFDIILQRCNAYNIPHPTYILQTSPNHFQAVWLYPRKKELVLNDKSLLDLWEKVQNGLFELFKDLGADANAKDSCRYLRNPYKKDAVNSKYPDKPGIEKQDGGGRVTLSEIYKASKQAGFIKAKEPKKEEERPKRNGQVSSTVQRRKLEGFLKQNPNWEGTHRDLFARLGIAERTGYLLVKWLKERGVLEVERVRIGRTWKSRFHYEFDTADKGNNSFFYSNNGTSYKLHYKLLLEFTREGFSCGVRNNGVFVLALWLKLAGVGFLDALGFLNSGFLKSRDVGAHKFGEREFERTVRSAFKHEYRHWHSLKSERLKKILVTLDLYSLQCENMAS